MKMLAFDTSTRFASIALAEDGTVILELNWQVGQQHSSQLLDRINWVLQTSRVSAGELGAIAVATGPGSFNGLRVALTAAKTMAFATGASLYGVPTLDVIARGCWPARQTAYAILDAGRGQVYAGLYDSEMNGMETWRPMTGYHIVYPVELAEAVTGSVLFCGEWTASIRQALELAFGSRARFVETSGSRRGAWLADLALLRHRRGERDTAAALEPLYLRRPAITRSSKVTLATAVSSDSVPQGERAASEEA